MYRALTELHRANFARAALSLVHNTSHCNAARRGVTQAPRRAFNCVSVFTILIKSARPYPLYPRVRIDFIGLAASAESRRAARIELGSILAARRDSWALECSKIVASDAPCRAASRRIAVRRIANQPKMRWRRGRPCACSLRSSTRAILYALRWLFRERRVLYPPISSLHRNYCLRILIEGPEIEHFDFVKSLDSWKNKINKRLVL